VIVFDLFQKAEHSLRSGYLAMGGLALVTLLLLVEGTSPAVGLFSNMLAADGFARYFKIIVSLGAILVMWMSLNSDELQERRVGEYYMLILTLVLGMFFLVSATHLLSIYIALEMVSIMSYLLSGYLKEQTRSNEASIKYVVFGAFSSGILLYGFSLLYGVTGSTSLYDIQAALAGGDVSPALLLLILVLVLVGFGYKIAAVPFHFWTPDVYEGSPTSVTLFFAIVPKVAALTVFIRFLYVPFINLIDQWQMIIVFISLASMILGAVAAIGQKNLKRLIAYSSIGHMGYALAGLAVGTNSGIQSSIIYISIYLIMNLGIFCCLFMMKRKNKFFDNLEDLSGLSKNHPIISLSLLILLFSLAGIPPMAGFFAKFYIFMSVIEQSMYFLAIVGLITTVVSAFYYLKIIKIIYFDPPKGIYDQDHHFGLKISLTIATLLILFYFVYPSGLINLVSHINLI